jgi:hypothetical protein
MTDEIIYEFKKFIEDELDNSHLIDIEEQGYQLSEYEVVKAKKRDEIKEAILKLIAKFENEKNNND